VHNLTIQTFQNHISGKWADSASGSTFANINPADTRDVVGHFQDSSEEDALAAVEAAHAAFDVWKKTPISKRAKILSDAAQLLTSRADDIAQELTREEGKPLNLARAEVLRAAEALRFYAVEGQTYT